MSIHKAHLRKLLQVFYLHESDLVSALREDIRTQIKKSKGAGGGGGDFPIPFWSDAKGHVIGVSDLKETTEQRIKDNRGRKRLYPQLRDGFLIWWEDKRRWSNENIHVLEESVIGYYEISHIGAQVKVENLLSLEIGDQTFKLIYPYFSEEPKLSEEAARLGLWLMNEVFLEHSINDMRILDVLRSKSFSIADYPLNGNEESLFLGRYTEIIKRWGTLRKEYH